MSFKDGIMYDPAYEITKIELVKVVLKNIVHWMSLKVYRIPGLDHNENPTLGRLSSIAYSKKSYFVLYV